MHASYLCLQVLLAANNRYSGGSAARCGLSRLYLVGQRENLSVLDLKVGCTRRTKFS
ncbi:hypothetical protein JYU34_006471 [Plutella xylostella]|uniref:Uncharacterized protein n=1 Tax=Plutella xylostella TaxID=51655 RepID=A0ABQ7QS28_PLUXY|nr:hypothetical protein JYU34_006471 [Plutella xylostella]